MTTLSIILFWVLLGLAAAQALIALGFIGALLGTEKGSGTFCAKHPAGRGGKRYLTPFPSGNPAPCAKTAVILCLRGSDPFLPACLEGILHQDYSHYDVRIVIDSREDPAWKTVEQVMARSGASHVHIRPLTQRRQTCSLKCSSLLQAISELDESYEVIALMDADTIPHRTWLRELVAPLREDRVAAATGNRWFVPASLSWGSLVRWVWNAAAVVQMYWYQIPWGGTLALKMSAFREGHLEERWAHSFGEDTMLYSVLGRLGYRIVFVPTLLMVNREDCSLAGFYRWVRRQLFTTRLNHPAWALVAGHGLAVSLVQWIGLAFLLVAVVTRNGPSLQWVLAGMGLYWGVMAGLLAALEAGVRRVLAARGEPTSWFKISGLFRVAAAMLLTQTIHLVALLRAWGQREVDWRGIRYRVQGPGQIRMSEYQPFLGRSPSDRSSESL